MPIRSCGVGIVNDGKARSAKITVAHVGCEQAVKGAGVGIAITEAIVIRVEKRLVTAIVEARNQDRSSSFDTELVLTVLGYGGRKEITRVYSFVTQVFEGRTVQRV